MADKQKRFRLVKRNPSIKGLSHQKIHSTVYIKSTTPYVSGVKRINKFLENLDKQAAIYVTVLGMGRAVEKTLSMALYFENTKHKRVEVYTRTVDLLDEVIDESAEESTSTSDSDSDDDEHKVTTLKNRKITGIELRLYP
ncbi:hypothetical protein TPHA_0A01180 [Tetrapisispora phaffii CBS 4417]|uniref:Uncharacterized protein n=1 Tax=Tetrapisispora phaffii (strain ATCC 24235 / CBS 4417 / NBRC 1672 / NRRL Y-8282 / UCD 70-5) TaxID=1071381 RepID=G8BMS4_TETPH|nr:hypothetical protein TPHA_0A01180 [Tetrapisispora phaffii CBS 4417]CCE61202.1 hypothetical protein TPHA_0A01180 [Tetrapisispora phaffii CBS 4417]